MAVVINGTTGITSPAESVSGNLTFTGTGNRITGDFSNATIASRVLLQSSTTNGQSALGLLPNGTSTQTQYLAFNSTDPSNSSYLQTLISATEARINSGQLGTGTNLPMTFYTGGSERMRIDTSGNVGIGTSSPGTWAGKLTVLDGGLSVAGSSGKSHTINVFTNGQTNNQVSLSQGFDSATDNIGYLYNRANAAFVFGTNNTERMRIDSSGNLLVGATSNPYNAKLVSVGFGDNVSADFYRPSASAYAAIVTFCSDAGGTRVLKSYIDPAGALVSTSDARLKENVQAFDAGLNCVLELNPVYFNWKGDASTQAGFIAQEVEQVLPIAVREMQSNGLNDMRTLDKSVLFPVLVKAIQEQQAIIEQLKADVAELKAAK